MRIYIVILLALPGNSRLDSSHVGHNEWIEGSRYLITISTSFLIYHDDRRVTSPCHLHHVFSRPQTCFSSPLSILQSPRGTLVNFNSQIFYSLKLILSQRRIIPVARCCKTQKSRSPKIGPEININHPTNNKFVGGGCGGDCVGGGGGGGDVYRSTKPGGDK